LFQVLAAITHFHLIVAVQVCQQESQMNDEARMTDDKGNPNPRMTKGSARTRLVIRKFDINSPFAIRHLAFGI
jgi:hypothetical protein